MAQFSLENNHDLMLAYDTYQRIIVTYRRGECMMRSLIAKMSGSEHIGTAGNWPRWDGCLNNA